ncbi:MAG: coproporphyrinogen dehydrogenase HemZ [Clostridia bacterium]|nr:coproporphyrinogen dehydrogenase HemZ [Clostridia bacterium]
MEIKIKGHELQYDVTGMSMLFFPGDTVVYTDRPKGEKRLYTRLAQNVAYAKFCYGDRIFCCQKKMTDGSRDALLEAVKYTIYRVFHQATGIAPPWGILTGIKPTGVYRRILEAKGFAKTRQFLLKNYCMQPEKIPLLHQICKVMETVETDSKKEASLYISIPFCPSRCTYCSFISVAAEKSHHLIDRYLEFLIPEIKEKCAVLKRNRLEIKSVYIGGGTPGILNPTQLKRLLAVVNECLPQQPIEFTFELGRPDTVTKEKLQLLKDAGVTRICINTQTTNDEILRAVGRNHTRAQYFDAVSLTTQMNFDSINTDLIAGLPGETEESFANSLEDVLAVGADNITIHTLSIKRSSRLHNEGDHFDPANDHVQRMLDRAYDRLLKAGYVPYYMYRQKNTVSNGENIGFARPETICKYNLYMMEDLHTVAACGAGASSKIITQQNGRIERIINMKYPYEYINENEKIARNTELLEEKIKESL